MHPSCQQLLVFETNGLCFPCNRTGSVLVNGSIGTATISSSGTGNVYLLGTNTSVGVDLAGTSSVYLRNANSKECTFISLQL